MKSESYVAIALAPSAQIWVTFFSLKWHFSHAAQFSFTGTEPQSDIGRNRKKNPSRGDVCELVAQKVFETNVQNGLQEIMIALAEDTVKRGSNF